MGQLSFTNGTTTHTLPYPVAYGGGIRTPRVVHVSYGGWRLVDRNVNANETRRVQMQWEQIGPDDMDIISEAYRALMAGATWDYTGPDEVEHQVHLDKSIPKLSKTMYAGVGGEVLYNARLNVILEQ